MYRRASIILLILSSFLSISSIAQPLEKDLRAYLFTYFTGGQGGQEAIYYAVSIDGYNYFALNGNNPVLNSADISSTGGVRDPYITRGANGYYYMVATDMTARLGWDSNRAMVLMKSTDLINWTSSVINIQNKFDGQEELKRVWAPQTIFDKEENNYMVYFSMKHGDGPDIIYYAYANEDFTDIDGEPRQLFFPEDGRSCIDGDIIIKDGLYHMFYKTEGHGNGIRVATTESLSSGLWKESTDYKQQTSESVEGSTVFKLNQSDHYILMYDVYMKGDFQFTSSTDLQTFEVIDEDISMDFKPRHGSILPITRTELNSLLKAWGTPDSFPRIDTNPILEGYYADPEIMYSKKYERYFLYPTSDGFTNWSGTYFKTFSSKDLVSWKDEGIILDLKKDVSWTDNNAWAPTIIERELNGNYEYFYYYTANKYIGVAKSNEPTGPFIDSGKPLIDFKLEGIDVGIEIDPDVFKDPKSGKYYLYWGNSYLAVAELGEDMVSIKESTISLLNPGATFREAVEVFERNGVYYFLWSENDTRSPDYRVRYATAKSPIGPLEFPDNNLILSKNEDVHPGIFGTGHNSVIQIPGTDQWYIIYHRFSVPYGINMGRAAGYHRELAIDEMNFGPTGEILPVIPTHTGIYPVRK